MKGFSAYLCSGSVGPADDPIVYGRDIAVRHALDAFWRYGTSDSYDFFLASEGGLKTTRAREVLEALLTPSSQKQARFFDIQQLKADFSAFDISVWHDFDADFTPAVSLRSRFSHNLYPVTATTHVLSYPCVLGQWIVPMLLADVQPCDALVSTSDSCRRALLNLIEHVCENLREQRGLDLSFRGTLPVIPLSVDTDVFRPRDKQPARAALGLPDDAFLIGWIGRVSAIDKADLVPLLQIFSRLLRANPERSLRLLIAGGGTDGAYAALHTCAEELGITGQMYWLRPLPPEQRAQVFAALDVFVSPADNVQETAGITPLEALASGIPQVVSDWDGYREAVDHGVTGFRIPTVWTACDESLCRVAGLYDNYDLQDHFALAQSIVIDQEGYQRALQLLIDSPDLCRKMSIASRQRALEHFHPGRIVQLHEALWHELREIADSTLWKPRPRSYDVPRWHASFGHYASHASATDSPVALTEEGRSVLTGASRLPIFGDLPQSISSNGLRHALETVATSGTLAQATARTSTELAIAPDIAERHLLWLIKHGLVSLSPID